jgi:hypothetical protein
MLLGGSERGMYHQAGKFLPPTLKMRFDVQDDWIDQVQAEIHNTRAQRYERNLADGAINLRVTREQMLATGEITGSQFRDMELESGRTVEGLPVDTLFYGDNPYLKGIDPDDFAEEDVKLKLKKAKEASVRESAQRKKESAREAVAALEWLLDEERRERLEEQGIDPNAPPGRNMAAPEVDAPMRKLPAMTSTKPTESADVESEKERKTVEKQFQKELEAVFDEYEEETDYDKLKAALLALLLVWLLKAYLDAMDTLEDEYGPSFDPADFAAEGVEWAAGYAPTLADQLVNTTKKAVEAGVPEQAFSDSRAELIAVTETTVASSAAFDDYRDLIERLGAKVEQRWETAADEKVCPICAPLHNQPREVWEAEFPQGPPAHGRCRCRR